MIFKAGSELPDCVVKSN